MSSPLLGVAAVSNSGDHDSDSLGRNSSDDEQERHLENEAESEMLINSSSDSSIGSLPLPDLTQKGLSSHYAGRARTFYDLSECSEEEAANLAKVEHPFNKRRRLYIQSRPSYGTIGSASCNAIVRREMVLPPPLAPLPPRSPRPSGQGYHRRQSFVEVNRRRDRREEVLVVVGRQESEEPKRDVDDGDGNNGAPFPCRLFDR